MNDLKLVTYKEASLLTEVSERTLKRMVQRGELTEYPFGRSKRLSLKELTTPRSRPGSERQD